MRKSKVWQIMAAAVAAAPGITLAEDVGLIGGEVRQASAPSGTLRAGTNYGRFQLAPLVPGGGGPDANVDGTFVGAGANQPGDGVSWQNPVNWSTNPQIPDGPTAIARFTGASNGASVTLSGTTVQLSRLFLNDPQLNAITTGGITLTAPATIDASGPFFQPQTVIFSLINPIGTTANPVTISGSNGLTKTGNAFVEINGNNTFTGPVSITGGGVIPASGDAAFGNPANPITINNGTLDVRTTNFNTSRVITVGAGGASIYYAGTGRTFVANGDITGSGTLRFNGGFGAPDAATINSNTSFTGALVNSAGTLNLAGAGAVLNAASIRNQGTLGLRGSGVNRIGDSTAVTLDGAVLVASDPGTEVMGNLVLEQSTSWVQMFPGGGGSTLQFSGVTRNNRATAAFRGDGLGSGGGSQVRFTTPPALVGAAGNQIIGWAYGNAANQSFTTPESEDNTLVTYGANGVTPVTNYVDINSSNASTNALVTDGGATVSGAASANALVMRASVAYAGAPITLGGTGSVTLTSGVILSANSGFQVDGTTINSTPGNVIDANIHSDAGEIIIHAPSAITFNGVISGNSGLTKSGGRTAFFNNNNTYTGETNLSGFVRFNKNVPSGAASPFGNSTTAINLYAGNFAPINPGTSAANGTMVGIIAADNNSGALTFARPLNARGTGTNLIRNFSNGALTLTGPINIAPESTLRFEGFGTGGGAGVSDQIIVDAPITGTGRLQIRNLASGGLVAGSFVRINSNNAAFTGGADVGGIIQLGHNSALGSGSVIMTNNATFSAFGGPRNIGNALFNVTGAVGVTGNQPFEWSGPITSTLGSFLIDSSNTALTTFSGSIQNGGGPFKVGAGTVVLSGNNTYDGTMSAGNIDATTGAPIDGDWLVLASNTAAGTDVGQSQVVGRSSIGMQGSINIGPELLLMSSTNDGADGAGALRSLSGNNTWGGRVTLIDLAASPGGPSRGSVGANAGATLNIGRSVIGSGDTATTFTFTKFGPGQVNVGGEALVSTAGTATSAFNGSIVNVHHLVVNEGRLAMSQSTGPQRNVSDVGSITLNGSSQFDLTNNALVVDYDAAGPSPYTDIRSKIVSGYNGGAWNGPGIITSLGNASTHGVGYAEASNVLTFAGSPPAASFLGDLVDQTAILARYTRYGDANLDGTVNLADFNRLAAGFGTGTRWDQGDFDYNGIVNLADFNRLAANFGQSAAGVAGSPTPQEWANLSAAIPEPSSLALAGIGVATLLRRRRHA